MFLVTATKNKLSSKLKVIEYKLKDLYINVYVDNKSSKIITNKNSIIVRDSVSENHEKLILCTIKIDKNDNRLSIKHETLSGKSVYYHINEKGDFYCSTNIKLLREAGVKLKENKELLPEFFIYRIILPPNTIYKSIFKIISGTEIIVRYDKRFKIEKTKKYSILNSENIKNKKIKNDFTKETARILRDSMKILGKKDVKMLLSGGIDSTILAKLSINVNNVNTTYSGGYPFETSEGNTEKEYAETAAKAIGTNHVYYEPTIKEYQIGMIESLYEAEEPLHHLQTIMFYLIFKNAIKQKDSIIVSGIGADGIYGEYLHNKIFRTRKILWRILSKRPFINILSYVAKKTKKGYYYINFLKKISSGKYSLSDPRNVLWSAGRYGKESWVLKHFNCSKKDIIRYRYETLKEYENSDFYDLISIKNFIGVNQTENIWTKMAEASGKRKYYPFNYQPLLDHALSISWKQKLKKPKNVLRLVLNYLDIPNFIITRKKSGFGVSHHNWALKNNVFEPFVKIAAKEFNIKEIRKMQSNNPEKAMTFWNIINYAIWKRIFIKNEPINKIIKELEDGIQ